VVDEHPINRLGLAAPLEESAKFPWNPCCEIVRIQGNKIENPNKVFGY